MSFASNRDIYLSFFQKPLRVVALHYWSILDLQRVEPERTILAERITRHFIRHEVQGANESPADLQQFFQFAATVFSEHPLQLIRWNIEEYERMTDGGHAIANEFISHQANWEWVQGILTGLLHSMFEPGVSRFFTFADVSRVSLVGSSWASRFAKSKSPKSADKKGIEEQGVSSSAEASQEIENRLRGVVSKTGSETSFGVSSKEIGKSIRASTSEEDDRTILGVLSGGPGDSESRLASGKNLKSNRVGISTDEAGLPVSDLSEPAISTADELTTDTLRLRGGAGNFESVQAISETPLPPRLLAAIPCQVIQISLHGPTLRQAWIANPQASTISRPSASFNPAQLSGFRMFRGMSIENPTAAAEIYFSGLDLLHGSRNEISPQSAIHTSFWPLRSFLWATFKATMCLPLLSPSQESFLKKKFMIGNKQLEGVFLMEFEYSTPSVDGLRTTSLGEDSMEVWTPMAERAWQQTTLADFCNRTEVRALQKLSEEGAIDVLHGPERRKTQETMRSWLGPHLRKPFYRSAHMTQKAVDALNARMIRCYAISYEPEATPVGIPVRTRKEKAFIPAIKKFFRRFIKKAQ